MKINFLGTAAAEGIPALFCVCELCEKTREAKGRNYRTRSQAMINDDLLIDFPPDTQMHEFQYGLELNKIKDIIITHGHDDHFYIKDLFYRGEPFSKINETFELNIHGNDKVYNKLLKKDETTGKRNKSTKFNELSEFVTYEIGNYKVTPLIADHDKNEKCFIYLVSDGDKTVLYGTDTGYFPDETWGYLQGVKLDLVALDCTFATVPNERRNHMNLDTCVEVKERLISEKIANENCIFILTHFCHNGETIYDELVPIADKYEFIVAYDNLEIDV